MDSLQFPPSLAYGALGIIAAGLLHRISKIGQREPLLPPGPPTTPVLGNIAILPKTDTYVKFNEWAKQYGEIFSLKVGSKTIIVLSSPEAIFHVMEKNGLITANKPSMAHMLWIFGEDGFLSSVQYGPLYRIWRKAANEMMSISACEKLAPIQLSEASQLLVSFLDRPEDFFEEIKRTVLSVGFSVFFGVRSPTISSPEPKTFLWSTEEVFHLCAPGAYPPVDLLPILHYLPDTLANNWKQRSEELRLTYDELWNGLLSKVERKMEAGISTGCFIETLTARASEWNLDRMTIRNMAGSYLVSAAHTTIATLQWFVMLATIYPKTQAKLREEIDRVVGPNRLPTPADMPNLPYLHAFIRELFRFRTIGPLGVPHESTEDQLYKGYLVPKGATIFVNIWGVFHDANIFENPDEFNPDRFMDPTPEQAKAWKKLETLQFGVGRRICPGMNLANTTVELTTACMIWAFEFQAPPKDGPHVDNFHAFLTCDPLPFKCDIKPRSERKADLIRQNFASYRPFFNRFEKDV